MPLHAKRGLRRLAFAGIAALALHAVVVSLLPRQPVPSGSETLEPVTLARIQPQPTPTPHVTPTPTPPPRTNLRIAPVPMAATASPVPRSVASAPAAPETGSLRPLVRSLAHSRPVWDAPAGGQDAGNGFRTGEGGDRGSGSGGGTGGNGTGAGAQPCGFVTFSDPNGSRYDKSTGGFYVDISMTVHFSNGGTSSLMLDYPWYYPSESANPWSNRNRNDPNFPTTFQQPPSEKRNAEPTLVRYVTAHTSADGYTLLKDCPPSSASSAPSPSPS